LFARISPLCSGPRCRKQIFLGYVEFGRDPPSFSIPRRNKEVKGEEKEGKKDLSCKKEAVSSRVSDPSRSQ